MASTAITNTEVVSQQRTKSSTRFHQEQRSMQTPRLPISTCYENLSTSTCKFKINGQWSLQSWSKHKLGISGKTISIYSASPTHRTECKEQGQQLWTKYTSQWSCGKYANTGSQNSSSVQPKVNNLDFLRILMCMSNALSHIPHFPSWRAHKNSSKTVHCFYAHKVGWMITKNSSARLQPWYTLLSYQSRLVHHNFCGLHAPACFRESIS